MDILTLIAVIVGVVALSWWIKWSSKGIAIASNMWGLGWSPGVRGATINAIASSLPELITATVFLVVLGDSKGFISGIATVAGSAIFNALIIPSLMAFVVFFKLKKSLNEHNNRIILRDGAWLLFSQVIILFIVRSGELTYLHGLSLLFIYSIYIFSLTRINLKTKTPRPAFSPSLKRKLYLNFVLGLIGVGVGCFFLVKGCVFISEEFNLSLPMIALIVAAAATSIPDAFLSMGDAIKGNSDDGISNAFGSNIFDLCVAMGLPITLYGLFAGPILIPAPLAANFSILWYALMGLTVLAITIMYFAKSLNWRHATLLLLSYLAFVGAVYNGCISL
jgi:cation:H+ antiporter